MIRHRVVLPQELRDLCSRLSPGIKRKVRESLRLLEQDPVAGKALERELIGFRSYPIPPYRIIYRIEPAGRIVRIIRIGHRRDVYEVLVQKLDAGEVRERRAIYVRR